MHYQNEINAAIREYYAENGMNSISNDNLLREHVELRGLDGDNAVIRQMDDYIDSAIELARMVASTFRG